MTEANATEAKIKEHPCLGDGIKRTKSHWIKHTRWDTFVVELDISYQASSNQAMNVS